MKNTCGAQRENASYFLYYIGRAKVFYCKERDCVRHIIAVFMLFSYQVAWPDSVTVGGVVGN
jgi:hypothetical protein